MASSCKQIDDTSKHIPENGNSLEGLVMPENVIVFIANKSKYPIVKTRLMTKNEYNSVVEHREEAIIDRVIPPTGTDTMSFNAYNLGVFRLSAYFLINGDTILKKSMPSDMLFNRTFYKGFARYEIGYNANKTSLPYECAYKY